MGDLAWIAEWLESDQIRAAVRAAILVTTGLIASRLLGRLIRKLAEDHLSVHALSLLVRVATYGLVAMFAISALHELGFQLSVMLGAAGILTVAIGFASQTSASNLVSGLFLIVEHPFAVADVIKVGDITGEVLSIDLLSVKLRTYDNLYVRIPNETIIKSEITNLTRFPIRRLDLQVGVAYKEDLEKVREVLMEVADKNPLSLEEPKPLIIMLGFGDSSINIQFSLWAARPKFLELRNSIHLEIKAAFDREGIEIPFPHRTLYTGAETDPMPVRVVSGGTASISSS